MPRKKAKDTLDYLGAGECAQVLRELLKRHRDLRGEANEIAESLIDDVSVEVLAEDIAYLVGSNSDGALGWAPDFPAEAAAWSLSLLLEQYPQRWRQAAGNRVIKAVEEQAGEWVEMLERVVRESAKKKRERR